MLRYSGFFYALNGIAISLKDVKIFFDTLFAGVSMKSEGEKYILALDQGTTTSRAILFDHNAKILCSLNEEFPQYYPQQGWVEHDAMEIFSSQLNVMKKTIEKAQISPSQIAAIGITNQRETVVLWDKNTGEPVHNAIVWQCRRTAPLCEQLIKRGLNEVITEKTGLLIDAYFSAPKIKWMLDNNPSLRHRAERGEILSRYYIIDYLAYLEAFGRKMPCNRRNKCKQNYALQYLCSRLG